MIYKKEKAENIGSSLMNMDAKILIYVNMWISYALLRIHVFCIYVYTHTNLNYYIYILHMCTHIHI